MVFQKSSNNLLVLLFSLLLFSFANTSCTKKPWVDPLEEKLGDSIKTTLAEKAHSYQYCPKGFYADATIRIETVLKTQSFSGFLQVLRPNHMKVVGTNPLGQPVLAFITDSKSFQSLNTLKKEMSLGKLSTLALKHDLSPELLENNWANKIYGLLPLSISQETLHNDVNSEGYWIRNGGNQVEESFQEYYLLTQDSLILKRLVITDKDDKTLASIDYSDWQQLEGCAIPGKLSISELPKGLVVDISLRNISPDHYLTDKDFTIEPPSGYIQHQYR